MTQVKKAIFPVGGLGTRFLPVTKAIPKEMLPVATKPLIQYAFEEAVEAGIEEFIFVTGRNKNAINNHFDHNFELQTKLSEQDKDDILEQVAGWVPKSGRIAFVPQGEPLGLGHAVWCARHFVKNEPFAVLLADEMVLAPRGEGLLKQMVDAYSKVESDASIVAIGEVAKEDVSKYGIIDPENPSEDLTKISGMVEKPAVGNAPSNLSLTGRYILQPEIFELLSQGKKTSGGEIQLTDAMAELLINSPYYGLKFKGERFDCGSIAGFLEANIAYALADLATKEITKDIIKKFNNKI